MPTEADLAELLSELSTVQDELLAIFREKQRLLAGDDPEALSQLWPREEAVLAKLRVCHERRRQLLVEAKSQGMPHTSLSVLSKALPGGRSNAARTELQANLREAAARRRLLAHHSLTNWVIAQRRLLHLSQMLEIFATGSQEQTTYGKGGPPSARGALLDAEG
ncbi:MAG: flagellar export chaperone FlgN [Planctomycetia bacterium]|nr:flagellar export chaperone FlgN [Planctomycetia bacterium]